jgi:hypothetical protein
MVWWSFLITIDKTINNILYIFYWYFTIKLLNIYYIEKVTRKNKKEINIKMFVVVISGSMTMSDNVVYSSFYTF